MNTSADQTNRRILVIANDSCVYECFRAILRPDTDRGALDEAEARLFGEKPPTRRTSGFAMDFAYRGEEAIESIRAALNKGEPYALAFVDMCMPRGIDGIETITRLWELDANLQVVICTAHFDYAWGDLTRLGGSDRLLILKKPFNAAEVRQMAELLCTKWELLRRGPASP